MYEGKELNKVTMIMASLAVFFGIIGGVASERIFSHINAKVLESESQTP